MYRRLLLTLVGKHISSDLPLCNYDSPIVQFQKISILPPQKGLEFPGGGGSIRPENLKKCMKLNWDSRGVGDLRKNPFCGGGMVIFWNYTLRLKFRVTSLTIYSHRPL